MIQRLSLLAILLGVFTAPCTVFAGPVVYPVKQVIGFDDPAVAGKAKSFGSFLAEAVPAALSEEFNSEFRKEFEGIAADTIDASNRNRVLVASLHLVRVSEYTVPKSISQCTEYHLPITLSIVFTNPLNGEVVYSFTDTSYAPITVPDSESAEQCDLLLRRVTKENYVQLLKSLIKKARQGYDPLQLDVMVAKIWKGLYILDKGTKFGIGRDDSLVDSSQQEIKVIYAAEDYSVATPLLVNKVAEGNKFFKIGRAHV